MLENLSFRLKLAAVVLPPVAVMSGMAGVIVKPRVDQASAANHDTHRADISTLAMEWADDIQVERAMSTRLLASGGRLGADELAAQRSLTDEAFTALSDRLDRSDATDISDAALDELLAIPEEIEQARNTVDAGVVSPASAMEAYTVPSQAIIDRITELSLTTRDGELVRSALAAASYLQGKEFLTRRVAIGASLTLADKPSLTEAGDLVATRLAYETAFGEFLASATPELAASYQKVLESTAFRTLEDQATAVHADTIGGEAMSVSGDEWWDNALDLIETIDGPDDEAFDAVSAAARNSQSSNRNGAIAAALLALVAAIGAATVTVLLGRSLERRLRRISNQAHDIARVQLPSVLEALRNPSEEIATALPTVDKDADDEIGSMADSFNTVLKASVETSIEHGRRRAKTVTDMLVNLGRRNQILIDRQLEIMDALEASQQDQATLEGLFKIDHMLTRMRRNAENLLVLAADSPARSWTEPVPLVDVLRAAISEAGDMARVDIENAHHGTAALTGRYTVDLSHMISELVENATTLSPPSSRVVVRIEPQASSGGVKLWVVDSGVGMTEDELADANRRLAEPPDIDELVTDRVGFQVVGRLARRLETPVHLQQNPGGGVAASIIVGPKLFDQPAVNLGVGSKDAAPRDGDGPRALSPRKARADEVPAERVDAEPPVLIGRIGERSETNGNAPSARTPSRNLDSMPDQIEVTPDADPEPVPASVETDADADAEPVDGPAERPAARAARDTGASGSGGRSVAKAARRQKDKQAASGSGQGLVKRQPGSSLATNSVAAEAEGGAFRRLPLPNEGVDAGEDHARRRLRMMNDLQSGVGRGRGDDEPENREK